MEVRRTTVVKLDVSHEQRRGGFGIFEPEESEPEYADLVAETHEELGEDLENTHDDML